MIDPRHERRRWSMLALQVVAVGLAVTGFGFTAGGILPGNPLFFLGTGALLWGLWRLADRGGRRRTAAGSAMEAIGLLVATLGSVVLFFALWEQFGGR